MAFRYNFTHQDVKDMREETGNGMITCRNILRKRDLDAAVKSLRTNFDPSLVTDILEELLNAAHDQ